MQDRAKRPIFIGFFFYPPMENTDNKNIIGLALGSGAAFGLAHIGVLHVLEREKIPIGIIVITVILPLVLPLVRSFTTQN